MKPLVDWPKFPDELFHLLLSPTEHNRVGVIVGKITPDCLCFRDVITTAHRILPASESDVDDNFGVTGASKYSASMQSSQGRYGLRFGGGSGSSSS